MSQAIFQHVTHDFHQNFSKATVYAVEQANLPVNEYDHFELIYDRYSPKAFGYILKHTETKEQAEEMLMAVYMKIWEDINAYNDPKTAEKRIIALVLSEFKKKNHREPLSESKFFQRAYNIFMIGTVIYLFFIK